MNEQNNLIIKREKAALAETTELYLRDLRVPMYNHQIMLFVGKLGVAIENALNVAYVEGMKKAKDEAELAEAPGAPCTCHCHSIADEQRKAPRSNSEI